jgi:hypothetical protein
MKHLILPDKQLSLHSGLVFYTVSYTGRLGKTTVVLGLLRSSKVSFQWESWLVMCQAEAESELGTRTVVTGNCFCTGSMSYLLCPVSADESSMYSALYGASTPSYKALIQLISSI